MAIDLHFLILLVDCLIRVRVDSIGALQLEQPVRMVAQSVVRRIGLVLHYLH